LMKTKIIGNIKLNLLIPMYVRNDMDYSNIVTILPYIKEFDIPYISDCWNRYVKQINKRGKKGVFGAISLV
jgi:hypothetical protein